VQVQQPSPPWRVFDAAEASPATDAVAGPPASGDPAQWPIQGVPPLAVIAAGLAIVVAAIAVVVVLASPQGSVVGPDDPGGTSAPDSGAIVVVDVGGAVARPGVYRLPGGSRVGDAIEAAGGFSPRVDVDRAGQVLNLAAVLRDGEQVIVPSRDDGAAGRPSGDSGSSGTGGSGGAGGAGLVNLNTASQLELESLPGIGPVTAGKILAARTEAPFRSVDELRERDILGPATFEKIRELVTVG
jgi:competence protein ComEA